MEKLETALNLKESLFFKREDLHPLMSHKGRSIPFMIECYLKQGCTKFTVSSSGNAALAAGLYISDYNKNNSDKLSLLILVGRNINEEKLDALQKLTDENIILQQVENPKQTAFQMDKDGQAKNLRQSTDDLALVGYEELAKEIAEELPRIAAIFIPTSSGTTASGLHLGFKKLGLNPEIHIVQTDACHPFVEKHNGESQLNTDNLSLADAIVDKVGHRKITVAQALQESQGNGWVATNKEIQEALTLIKEKEDVVLSPNSVLSLVGLQQSLANGKIITGPIVCLITGK